MLGGKGISRDFCFDFGLPIDCNFLMGEENDFFSSRTVKVGAFDSD